MADSILDSGDLCIFGDWHFTITETRDYPGDPAPVLEFQLRDVPKRCACKRQHSPDLFRGRMEREDALRLANAIVRHYAITDGRDALRARDRQYAAREHARLAALDARRKQLAEQD